MKKQIKKDKNIRKLFAQQELDNIILKSIIKNENLSLIVKWNAVSKLASFSRSQNKTRFVNRCILTNRKAKFNRIFKKFSRLSFLNLARSGTISGLKKSSW
uniref:Ribosomal protein S14 n=1 Tax=Thalassiosira nordenskioeldii TaxID=83372 RepID=A0A891GUB4_THANO|nr:ribosomal protein S14 [Thalassiosira nordenskioeldii]QRK25900.1 ribosomal protein S14 [Thalassiosira nordenskioeldii]